MVGHPSLREVVGADLFRAVSGTDLAAAKVRLFIVAPLHLQIIEFGAQERPGFRLVLQLGFLRLAVDDNAGGIMGQPHCGIGRIDALSAIAGSTHDIDADVLIRDINLDIIFHFRDHRDRTGRSMDPAPGFGHRYALDTMDAALIFQTGVSAFTGDDKAHRLHTSDADLFKAYRLYLPSAALGIMDIHSVNITGKKSSFVAAGAGADLYDHILVIIRIFGEKKDPETFLQFGEFLTRSGQFLLGQGAHILVALFLQDHLRLFGISACLFVCLIRLYKGRKIALFLHQFPKVLLIRSNIRTHQFLRNIFISEGNTLQFFKHLHYPFSASCSVLLSRHGHFDCSPE